MIANEYPKIQDTTCILPDLKKGGFLYAVRCLLTSFANSPSMPGRGILLPRKEGGINFWSSP